VVRKFPLPDDLDRAERLRAARALVRKFDRPKVRTTRHITETRRGRHFVRIVIERRSANGADQLEMFCTDEG